GTLILVTMHVAAMQPGTIIGSMQPIEYDPLTGRYVPVNDTKIINPILEFLDEHAGPKGRNMTAVRAFVTENLNLGAEDALKYGVINYVARDLSDLLRQMNGTEVFIPYAGKRFLLVTDGAAVERYEPPMRVKIVHHLSEPMLNSVLLSLGLAITLLSIVAGHPQYAPLGVLLLALGFLGSGYSINATTLFLLAAGTALLVTELVTPGFGVLGMTGIAMLLFGIALLPTGGGYYFSREYARGFLYAAYASGGLLGPLTGFAIYKIIQVRKKKPFEYWTVEGKTGRALDNFDENTEGFVIIEGEYWRAISRGGPVTAGDLVRVLEKRGPLLVVEKISEQATEEAESRGRA
ncbi:MAG: NfeD family protein, partial [Fervidicoccaceae archaeon]